jgi:hypothetical protein
MFGLFDAATPFPRTITKRYTRTSSSTGLENQQQKKFRFACVAYTKLNPTTSTRLLARRMGTNAT